MPNFSTLLVIISVTSVFVFLLTIGRLFAYNRKYHLPEMSYTKLFRILTKEHVAILYGVIVGLHFVFTIWFIWTL